MSRFTLLSLSMQAPLDDHRLLKVTLKECTNLEDEDGALNENDPFAILRLLEGSQQKQKSTRIKGSLHPTWNEVFYFKVKNEKNLNVRILDHDPVSADDFLGSINIPIHNIEKSSTTSYNVRGNGKCKVKTEWKQTWCVTLYEHISYNTRTNENNGWTLTTRETKRHNMPTNRNEAVSSAKVNTGCTFTGYEHFNLRGRKWEASTDNPNIDRIGHHDRLSSFKCTCDPVDCKWNKWGSWNKCSKTCGGGEKARSRSNTAQQYGGKTCQGPHTETRTCNTQACPEGRARRNSYWQAKSLSKDTDELITCSNENSGHEEGPWSLDECKIKAVEKKKILHLFPEQRDSGEKPEK